jgi:hypothetical protein
MHLLPQLQLHAADINTQPARLTKGFLNPTACNQKRTAKGPNHLFFTQKPLLVARLFTPQNWVDRTQR